MPKTLSTKNMTLPRRPSDWGFYFRTLIFGVIVFALCYSYTTWSKIPNALNKSMADTATWLIGFSMILSSLGYYFNLFDSKVIYRKYLGLVGFGFGLLHIWLSLPALQSLSQASAWQKGTMWPALTGLIAATIFTVMALVSNNMMTRTLGGKLWRYILRTGYLAILFVEAHVILLKGPRWVTWYQGGMKTPPSMSLILAAFIFIVLLMRIALWWSTSRKKV
jgi:DMSO/TMAO reductase YedYZ heme-binding membrane subunit